MPHTCVLHIAKLKANHPRRCEKRAKAMLHGLAMVIKCQALKLLKYLLYCFTNSAESHKYPRYPYIIATV